MSAARLRPWAAAGLVLSGAAAAACWPVTTRWGVNYRWTSTTIPLYEKAVNFVSRDLQTRRLAREVVAGTRTDEERLERIFAWVQARVRPAPEDWPIVDDHPLHILLRGYGAEDQRTEAFALLASYAGFRAAMVTVRPDAEAPGLLLAQTRAGSRVWVFDVVHGLAFRDAQGRLADLDMLRREPSLIRAAAGGRTVNGRPYEAYVLNPSVTFGAGPGRMEAQQPWARLGQELGRWWRWGRRDG